MNKWVNDGRHSLMLLYNSFFILQSDLLKMQIRSGSLYFLIPQGFSIVLKEEPKLPYHLLPPSLTSSSTTLFLIYYLSVHWAFFCSLNMPGLFQPYGLCIWYFLLWDILPHQRAHSGHSSLSSNITFSVRPFLTIFLNEHASFPSLLALTPIWNHIVHLSIMYCLSPSLECKLHEGCPLLYLQGLVQWVSHSRLIEQMNGWKKEYDNSLLWWRGWSCQTQRQTEEWFIMIKKARLVRTDRGSQDKM